MFPDGFHAMAGVENPLEPDARQTAEFAGAWRLWRALPYEVPRCQAGQGHLRNLRQ